MANVGQVGRGVQFCYDGLGIANKIKPAASDFVGNPDTARRCSSTAEQRFCKPFDTSTNTNKIKGIEQSPKALGVLLGALAIQADPRLVELAKAWPTLPEPLRAGIMAMVQSAVK